MANESNPGQTVPGGAYPALMAAVSVASIGSAFGLAAAPIDGTAKAAGFLLIVTSYLVFTAVVYFRGRRSTNDVVDAEARAEQSLAVLEEIAEFFGGTIKTADAFRLVVSKVDEMTPFDAVVLGVVDREAGRIRVVQASGEQSKKLRETETDIHMGLAGKCADFGAIQVEQRNSAGIASFSNRSLTDFRSSAVIPLKRHSEVLAVLQFYSASPAAFDAAAVAILEAVGERVAPMILAALAYESSVNSALTDSTTGLPNERAFRMVLEGQIAESHRRGSERPLTIIAFEIKQFDEVNRRFGHAVGDRLYDNAAAVLKAQLRQMDLLARSSNDEFLAVLPTADENVAERIVERIQAELRSIRFPVSESESIGLEVGCGIAMFGRHGEAAEALIAAARQRKRQQLLPSSTSVLWFPGNSVD
ncbi:MAG: sensor domain-containing diguanylate cyclase [Acidobacteriota bacterium]